MIFALIDGLIVGEPGFPGGQNRSTAISIINSLGLQRLDFSKNS